MPFMNDVSTFFNFVFSAVASLDFGTLIVIALSVYGGLAVLFGAACAASPALRRSDKRPVFHFVNAFTAVFFSLLLIGLKASAALFFATLFWLAGYAYYGALCAACRSKKPRTVQLSGFASLPDLPRAAKKAEVPPADGRGVRLGHALSIADTLLIKQLSRADRQELEKIKTALTVAQIKGTLSPQEGERVNDCFNSLVRLMSKYGCR